MRFWDSSALVPLLVAEETSPAVRAEFERDPEVIACCATGIEREGGLRPIEMAAAVERLAALEFAWAEVQPTDALRDLAARLSLAAEREGLRVVRPAA